MIEGDISIVTDDWLYNVYNRWIVESSHPLSNSLLSIWAYGGGSSKIGNIPLASPADIAGSGVRVCGDGWGAPKPFLLLFCCPVSPHLHFVQVRALPHLSALDYRVGVGVPYIERVLAYSL